MYFAMDEIGSGNAVKLEKLTSTAEKWQFIDAAAKQYGFEGIQVTNASIYKKNDIPLDKLPDHIRKFRLTYHVGGLHDLSQEGADAHYSQVIADSFHSAVTNRMEDVSIHPPYLPPERHPHREKAREKFSGIIENWLPRFEREGISFSVETHVGGHVFLFDGLEDIKAYLAPYPNLGVLIDISHNVNDGRSVRDILQLMGALKLTGFHLSDAIPGAELKKGTHLPVGAGNIDFAEILQPFQKMDHLYGALEILSGDEQIRQSLAALKACAGAAS